MRCALTIALLAAILSVPLPAQQRETILAQDKAAALGAHFAATVRARTTPLAIEGVNQYVTALGRILAAEIPNAPAHWEFTVVQQPGNWAHEPLGLPGGYVFVPAALMTACNDEAEFASMLADSMAHAASPALIRWDRASVPLLFADAGLGSDDSTLVPISLRPVEQERELQADGIAVAAVSHAGFDGHALLTYLLRAQNRLQSRAERTAASARLARLGETLARSINQGSPRAPSASFALTRARVREAEQASSKPAKLPSLLSPAK